MTNTKFNTPGLKAFGEGLGRLRKNRRMIWLLFALTSLYCVCLAAISIANGIGPERWWLATLNLYLPQWCWILPGLALAAAMLCVAPRWCWAPIGCVLWVGGPLMGFRWHTARNVPGTH